MVKQSCESIKQFTAGDRLDLVEKEQASLEHIKVYLPTQLSEEQVQTFVQQAITETGAASPGDMGKVMCWLKPKLNGQADMGQVSQQVKANLSS